MSDFIAGFSSAVLVVAIVEYFSISSPVALALVPLLCYLLYRLFKGVLVNV